MADGDTTWYGALAPEYQAHVTGKGWEKLDPAVAAAEAAKAHYAAEKLIGHPPDQMLRLPKDATDPSYQGIYDRVVGMNTPKDPSEYKFDGVKFSDGSTPSEADVAFMRGMAAKYKLPAHVATSIASDIAARAEQIAADEDRGTDTQRQAVQAVLRTTWGGEYDRRSFTASKAAEAAGLTPAALQLWQSLPAEEYVANMNALVTMGTALNEATILRGGAPAVDNTANLSREQAAARIQELKTDTQWVKNFLDGQPEAVRMFDRLNRIQHGAPLS